MTPETIELISLTDRAISFSRRIAHPVCHHHWHQCLQILLIEQGEGIVIVDNQQYALLPGRVFIFPPFKLHKIMVDEEEIEGFRRTVIDVDHQALDLFLRDFPRQHSRLHQLCHPSGAVTVCDLRQLMPGLDALYGVYQRIFASADFTLADSACLLMQLLNFFSPRSESNERLDERLSTRVMQWIETHYEQKFSLAELAGVLNFSRSYISRAFKQETGGLIQDYLLIRRIRQACEYLREGELPVEAIAEQTGFADTSYFITCFKKLIGDTPLKYRKRHQEDGV